MKYGIVWAAAMLLATAALAGQAWDATWDGRAVTLTVGEQPTLTLEMAAGTGYQWTLAQGDAKILDVGEPQISADATPGLVGGPVKYQWTITGKGEGKTTLRAALARSWEKDKPPAKTVTLSIEIKAAKN